MKKTLFSILCTTFFLTACTTGEKEPRTWQQDLGSTQAETINKNIPLLEKQLTEPKKDAKSVKSTSKKTLGR